MTVKKHQLHINEMAQVYFNARGMPHEVRIRRALSHNWTGRHTKPVVGDLTQAVNDYLQRQRQIPRGDSEITHYYVSNALESVGYKQVTRYSFYLVP